MSFSAMLGLLNSRIHAGANPGGGGNKGDTPPLPEIRCGTIVLKQSTSTPWYEKSVVVIIHIKLYSFNKEY